jgi:PAS domain-containing protein
MKKERTELTDAQLLRQKAEEKLIEKSKTTGTPKLESDVKRLLHELQVHQIELEMQNDELRHANEVVEAALRKFTLLYDFAPLGYFTLEKEGSIQDLNFTGAELLGEKRYSLINSNFKLFVTAESMPVFNEFFWQLYKTNAKQSCKIWLGYDKQLLCPVYMEGIVIEDEHNCLLSVLDISDAFKYGDKLENTGLNT